MMRIGRASSLSRKAASRNASSWSDMAGENVSSSDEPIPGWVSGTRARAVRRDRDGTGQRGDPPKRGWTIPPGAAQEANPIAASPEVLAKGKKLYEDNCQKCHGKGGKGDGPDADPDNMPEDLSIRPAPRATRTA